MPCWEEEEAEGEEPVPWAARLMWSGTGWLRASSLYAMICARSWVSCGGLSSEGFDEDDEPPPSDEGPPPGGAALPAPEPLDGGGPPPGGPPLPYPCEGPSGGSDPAGGWCGCGPDW